MFVLRLWTRKGPKTSFYSVWKDDAEESETNRFFAKQYKKNALKRPVQELMNLLVNVIGKEHGAVDGFFNRDEAGVYGLPPHGSVRVGSRNMQYPGFPLRLYAMRVGPENNIVVLFNGGEKTSQKNADSDDLNVKMHEARTFARKINEAIHDGLIVVDEENATLTDEYGNEEIVID